MLNNIAEHIISKCGGVNVVASWTGVTTKTVHCWTYEREKGGTGGIIPAKYQPTILKQAVDSGIPLSPDDFFYVPATHTPPEKSSGTQGGE